MNEPTSITVTIQNDGLINEANINEYHHRIIKMIRADHEH